MAGAKWSPDILDIDLADGSALSGSSRALCIAGLTEMLDRYEWEEVDDATWDTIESAVSTAMNEVMADVS